MPTVALVLVTCNNYYSADTLHKVSHKVGMEKRIQWINEGERSSKYFCKLENKYFVEKQQKIELNDGSCVTDQRKI